MIYILFLNFLHFIDIQWRRTSFERRYGENKTASTTLPISFSNVYIVMNQDNGYNNYISAFLNAIVVQINTKNINYRFGYGESTECSLFAIGK